MKMPPMDHLTVTGTLFVRHSQNSAIVVPPKLTTCQKSDEWDGFIGLNMVTDLGLQTIAALLGGGFGTPMVGAHGYSIGTIVRPDAVPATGAYVYEMRIGNIANPAATVPGSTGLTGGYVWSGKMTVNAPTLTCAYPFVGAVDFTTLVPNALLDPGVLSFTEEGLFSIDGALLARIVLATPWNKPVSGFTQFTHRISFARAV